VAPQAAGCELVADQFSSPPLGRWSPTWRQGIAAVDAAIGALVDGGLSRDRIALAGFSQGGCLALEYAARRGGVRAVFGLSAGLVGTGDAEGGPMEALYGYGPKRFAYGSDLAGTPVEITVHAKDPHIPLARARESLAVFEALGADARLSVTPGAGHGIGPEAVAAMRGHFNV
jgi:phospholipase/carboxylesterase